MARAAIVVLTYNTERFVDSCFGSLQRARLGGAEVIAVDNASKDGTVGAIRERFPWVTVVETGANLGFAGGNDVGMLRALDAGAEWIYLLNPDTDVDEGFLEEALAVAEADPRAGAVQSLLLLDPERDRVNTCGNEIHFLGFGYCGGYRTHRGEAPTQSREITFASGAASLWRAEALREVGLLDEELFLYHEDLDLGWRLRVAGWHARLAPRSVVFHHYEFSRNKQKYFFLERNRYLVLGKNLRLRTLLVLAPFLAAAELGILAVALMAGWLPEKLRADLALLRPTTLRRLVAARREVQRTRRASDREVMAVFTPIVAFDGLEGGWIPKLLAWPMRLVWKVIRPVLG